MALVDFRCPACGGALTDPGVGATLQCPFCSTSVMVPPELIAARTAAQPPAPAPAPAAPVPPAAPPAPAPAPAAPVPPAAPPAAAPTQPAAAGHPKAPAAPPTPAAPAAGAAAPVDDDVWKVGEKTFAYWEADGYYYPAVVAASSPDEGVQVRFDDGNTADLSGEDLMDWEVAEDDEVEGLFDQDGQYYAALVTAVNGEQVSLEFEDGSTVDTDLNHLRLADTWAEGDRIFAFWEPDEYYYAATITGFDDDGNLEVRFDDGSSAVLTEDEIAFLDLGVDDEIEAKFSGDDLFYAAVVRDLDEERVQVEYEDGTTEWTTLAGVRVMFEE